LLRFRRCWFHIHSGK